LPGRLRGWPKNKKNRPFMPDKKALRTTLSGPARTASSQRQHQPDPILDFAHNVFRKSCRPMGKAAFVNGHQL
jgi:hypothetical protein